MSIEFNEKGKYFTNIITKIPVPAIVQTVTHKIVGMIHIRPGTRVKDELDQSELFMAMTDVKLFDLQGKQIQTCDFISVNRSHIVWVVPKEENSADEASR